MSDISVVMCTYNGEKFIEKQLDSILAQTIPPAEIIVCDDGSTDGTLCIVESMARTSGSPIHVHRNERRLGFAENFLQACDYVHSPLVAFSDQDDKWAPGKLDTARREMLRADAVLCVHPVRLIDIDGSPIGDSRRRPTRTRVVPPLTSDPWGNFYGFTMLFDRSLLDRIPRAARGLDPHAREVELSHDRWIYFLAATFGRTVVVPECLADYRQHDAQAYGGEKSRTIRERIATKLLAGQSQARYLAGVAAHRAALLESPTGFGDHETWAAGAARWRTIESHLLSRARLYDRMSQTARLKLLATIVRSGAYRPFRKGGLGRERLAEDVTVTALKCFDSSCP